MILTVKKDGTGDFLSVQRAVDAAVPGDEIILFPGVYEERVIVDKPGLTVRGVSREQAEHTVLRARACAKDLDSGGKEKGTFLSYTLLVSAPEVCLRDLTVENAAGDGRQVGQAVAAYAAGDRDAWYHVILLAHQDTLFCGPVIPKVRDDALPRQLTATAESAGDCGPVYGRQYFEECEIRGDVDFIFGPYRCWFERCTLRMNERGGWYTAANTPEESPFGMVFHECLLTGEGNGYLGRPWRAFAATAFLCCEMDEHVHAWGFADWDENRVVTERLCEYGTRGARSELSLRHPAEGRLTPEQAARYTRERVLDGWLPECGSSYGAI